MLLDLGLVSGCSKAYDSLEILDWGYLMIGLSFLIAANYPVFFDLGLLWELLLELLSIINDNFF